MSALQIVFLWKSQLSLVAPGMNLGLNAVQHGMRVTAALPDAPCPTLPDLQHGKALARLHLGTATGFTAGKQPGAPNHGVGKLLPWQLGDRLMSAMCYRSSSCSLVFSRQAGGAEGPGQGSPWEAQQ